MIELELKVTVPRSAVYGAVVVGVESGMYSSFRVTGGWEKAWRAADEETPDAFAGITLEDRYAREEDYEPAGPPIKLTDKALEAGLTLFAKKHPKLMGEIVAEDGDALTCDAFLQCVAFGSIVYG